MALGSDFVRLSLYLIGVLVEFPMPDLSKRLSICLSLSELCLSSKDIACYAFSKNFDVFYECNIDSRLLDFFNEESTDSL